MLTRKVTDDDHFINLSSSAQALYLHLSMSADDDGFCNQVSSCMFRAHASVTDLQALLDNKYLIQFENGVIVIKHWRMANSLRSDRHKPTNFQEELARLELKDNGAYTLKTDVVAERLPDGCQTVAACLPQDSIGKVSIDKDSIEEDKSGQKPASATKKRFIPPTVDEVDAYCKERKNAVDAETFVDFYSAKGWRVGSQPMRDWKAAVRTWEKREAQTPQKPQKWSGKAATAKTSRATLDELDALYSSL